MRGAVAGGRILNELAFPSGYSKGMTYRQWVAGLLLSGFYANDFPRFDGDDKRDRELAAEEMQRRAEFAVAQADALIAALTPKESAQ